MNTFNIYIHIIALFFLTIFVTVVSAENSSTQSSTCAVESINDIAPMTDGFSVSPVDENIIAITRPAKGASQVFIHDRRTGKERCITCEKISNGPRPDQHTGVPSFLADGKHLVLQVEMADHPLPKQTGSLGAGWFNNIWITTIDGDQWWPLTNYPNGKDDRFGALIPEVTPDGKKIAWAELYKSDPQAQRKYIKGKNVTGGAPWGHWRIKTANIVWTDGIPRLENEIAWQPGNANFYETQEWSADGRYLLFASDLQRETPHAMDLWMLDTQTKDFAPATNQPEAWVEFGSISPDGKTIAFMSSDCCKYNPAKHAKKKLRTELYLKDAHQSDRIRLTHFNKRGYPESIPLGGGATVVKMRWSKDGKKIYFGLPFYGLTGKPRGVWLKELIFSGACGLN